MADALVIRVMDEMKQDLLRREAAQMEAMARRWRELEQRLEAQMLALAQELEQRRASGRPVTQGALFRLQRYQALLAQIRDEWAAYADYAEALILQNQQAWALQGATDAIRAVDLIAGGTVSLTRLPVEAAENLAGLLGNGAPLRTLLMNSAKEAEAIDALTRALLEGVVLGRNPRKTARDMADGLARGLNQALNIARTEQIRPYRQLNRQQYRASGVVEGYYRLATRDSRVCPACLSRDGEFIPLDEEMAEHPSGRCAQVPAVIGYSSPQWQKGPAWLRQQPAAVQRDVLGPGRYQAWKDGSFRLEDLAVVKRDATWGGNLHTAPLQELVG